MKGEVIGITSAKYSGTTESGATIEGIGFAIPMDDVIDMLEDIMETGHPSNAYLGVTVKELDNETAQQYGVAGGALVNAVEAGGAAEKGGIQAGDVIVKIDDDTISNVNDLTRALRNFKAGDTTKITVYRGGAELELTITLDEKPADTNATVPAETQQGKMPENGSYDEWYDFFFGGKG
jgi:serine protease Do